MTYFKYFVLILSTLFSRSLCLTFGLRSHDFNIIINVTKINCQQIALFSHTGFWWLRLRCRRGQNLFSKILNNGGISRFGSPALKRQMAILIGQWAGCKTTSPKNRLHESNALTISVHFIILLWVFYRKLANNILTTTFLFMFYIMMLQDYLFILIYSRSIKKSTYSTILLLVSIRQ